MLCARELRGSALLSVMPAGFNLFCFARKTMQQKITQKTALWHKLQGSGMEHEGREGGPKCLIYPLAIWDWI
jgi:hypothetical protein